MRQRLVSETKIAMLSKNKERLSTLRLINAAIKDRDIAVRSEENYEGVNDQEIIQILSKMIKQRVESIKQYEEAGRIELAESERNEMKVIQEFLPKQMNENEIKNAVIQVIKDTNSSSIRDIGKVMNELKKKYAGKADFSKISEIVKNTLS
tara:strand:- start:726 stop:1178 length:453 start_codon:yes stop_codon:yes gene_type:complete